MLSWTRLVNVFSIMLLMTSFAFATAPEWIKEGVELEYSSGSDTVIFSVMERTSTDIVIDIETDGVVRTATENASAITGQFWFDQSLLEGTSKYHHIEEFEVTGEGTQTFAGEKWDTVTLQTVISGATITKVYDRETGLMLKQTVSAQGAPVVTLTRYSFSDSEEPAPPPVEPTPEPAAEQEPTIGEAAEQEATADEGTVLPTVQEEESEVIVAPPVVEEPLPEEEKPTEKKSCCPSAAILLGLAALAVIRQHHFR